MKRTTKTASQKKVSRGKSKGKFLQKWVAQRISDLTGIPWGRDELIESRQMSQPGSDVVLRGEALRRFPFAIECASGQSIGWMKKMRQAQEHRRVMRRSHKFIGRRQWLLFLKKKEFQTPIVLMDAEMFFTLMDCALNADMSYDPYACRNVKKTDSTVRAIKEEK